MPTPLQLGTHLNVRRSRWAFLAASLGSMLWLSGCPCAGRLCRVDTRVWTQAQVNEQRRFPERYDPDLAVPRLRGLPASAPTFGVVFSGGGTRSASATLGQLRALRELGWLDKVHYISAVSGGSWAAVPYTYLPGGAAEDTQFLGEYIGPEKVTEARWNAAEKGSLAQAIHKSASVARGIKAWFSLKGDESFAFIVSDIFLKPFGLEDTQKLFTAHGGARDHIVRRAAAPAEHHFLEKDFYTSRDDRPYLIVGATLLLHSSWCSLNKPTQIYPVEMTQLYTGVPTVFGPTAPNRSKIGGGWIESFAYDSKAPPKITTPYTSVELGRQRYRFTLGDMMAASGAAPQAVFHSGLARCLSLGLTANFGFPEFRHWSIRAGSGLVGKEYAHGDGGNLDNVGLLPLLSRGVSHILVFVNTQSDFSAAAAGEEITKKNIYGDVIDYFRWGRTRRHDATNNNVIADTEELARLHAAFADDRSKELPLVHCQHYQIKANPRHNIVAYQPRICWVYLDRTEPWLKAIRTNDKLGRYASRMCKGLDDDGRCESRPPFKRFPHYWTFGNNFGVIVLKPAQVHALADLASWTVMTSLKELREGLAGLGLK